MGHEIAEPFGLLNPFNESMLSAYKTHVYKEKNNHPVPFPLAHTCLPLTPTTRGSALPSDSGTQAVPVHSPCPCP